MTAILKDKRYSTATATLLAGDDYWDGHNFERSGTNQFLYRTPKGNYFTVQLTQWEGEAGGIEVVDEGEAVELFGEMREKRVEYEAAFPGLKVEDA